MGSVWAQTVPEDLNRKMAETKTHLQDFLESNPKKYPQFNEIKKKYQLIKPIISSEINHLKNIQIQNEKKITSRIQILKKKNDPMGLEKMNNLAFELANLKTSQEATRISQLEQFMADVEAPLREQMSIFEEQDRNYADVVDEVYLIQQELVKLKASQLLKEPVSEYEDKIYEIKTCMEEVKRKIKNNEPKYEGKIYSDHLKNVNAFYQVTNNIFSNDTPLELYHDVLAVKSGAIHSETVLAVMGGGVWVNQKINVGSFQFFKELILKFSQSNLKIEIRNATGQDASFVSSGKWMKKYRRYGSDNYSTYVVLYGKDFSPGRYYVCALSETDQVLDVMVEGKAVIKNLEIDPRDSIKNFLNVSGGYKKVSLNKGFKKTLFAIETKREIDRRGESDDVRGFTVFEPDSTVCDRL